MVTPFEHCPLPSGEKCQPANLRLVGKQVYEKLLSKFKGLLIVTLFGSLLGVYYMQMSLLIPLIQSLLLIRFQVISLGQQKMTNFNSNSYLAT